jgi:mRNA interferase MazF
MPEVEDMSISEKFIKELDRLNEKERQEVLEKIKEKYMSKDFILLSKNYSCWDNEEDDIYNEYKVKQGDVWLADVIFKDTLQSKQRPVLIVGNELALDVDVIIAPITSQQPRNGFDVVLKYWREAGLLKPSLVRTSKIIPIHGSELKRKLGVLHEHDLDRVLHMCRELF